MTEREVLIELLDNGCYAATSKLKGDNNTNEKLCEFLADYLLKNGVTVPPVKIGTTVYELRHKAVYNGRRTDSSISTQRLLKMAVSRGDDIYISGKPYTKSDYTRLGITVFLTVEEAVEELQLFGVENAVKFI